MPVQREAELAGQFIYNLADHPVLIFMVRTSGGRFLKIVLHTTPVS